MSSPDAVRARWEAAVEASLPPESDPGARNRAITATYARWYLAPGGHLKWCGMAVFASLTVGKVLAARDRFPRFQDDFERFRATNNRVFRDVAWAFRAWLDPEGGFAPVEAALSGVEDERPAAWHAIERARRTGEVEAAWEGARHILRYEQRVHVQPGFTELGRRFRLLFSLLAHTNYRDVAPDAPRRWYFPDRVRAGSRWPDIGRFEERWAWADTDALALYRQLDEQGALRAGMEAIAASP